MMDELKKAIAAIEVVLDEMDAEEIVEELIKKAIDANVTFLDLDDGARFNHLHGIGKWVTIYRKNQGEGYVDFEKWLIVDSKVLHDFIGKHYPDMKRVPRIWLKPITVIGIERDSFYHSAETRRKIALARVEFVEKWLAKN